MNAPRCKPGQVAMVVRASQGQPCSVHRLGVPVIVDRRTSFMEAWALGMESEGPVWRLREPIECPFGFLTCDGIKALPDSCLRPFDPDSAAEPATTPSEVTA